MVNYAFHKEMLGELRIEQNKAIVAEKQAKVPGQILYPAEKEDVDILMNSEKSYIRPNDAEGGTIVRLVRLSDPVTSPVARTFRNSVYGVRGTEKWDHLGFGLFCSFLVSSLGFWQLERMKWKKNLIEIRTERL